MNVLAAWAVFVLIWCAVATVVAVGFAALVGGWRTKRRTLAAWTRAADTEVQR